MNEDIFKILESVHVTDAGFLKITEETVSGPEEKVFKRTVVRHPGAVVVVPVEGDSHAILVRQYRAAVDGWLLEVPAGKRDVDGEAPEVTASRELLEETGLRAGRLVLLAEFYNTPGFCDEYTYLFAALDLEDAGGRQPIGAEEIAMTLERIALADVETLISTGSIMDAKTIIGLLLARSLVAGNFVGRL